MTDDARAPLGPTPGTGDFTQAVRSLSDRFAAEAAELDPDAPIASDAWPTVGGMVDHLGQIQRWCTEVLRTGAAVDRAEHVRPAERDRFAWFVEGSAALATELGTRDPATGCWAFIPGGTNGFWARRQAHEARKHLWDIRTATTPVPELPEAGGPEMAADIVDELYAVFLARAVRGGLAPLASPPSRWSRPTRRSRGIWRPTGASSVPPRCPPTRRPRCSRAGSAISPCSRGIAPHRRTCPTASRSPDRRPPSRPTATPPSIPD